MAWRGAVDRVIEEIGQDDGPPGQGRSDDEEPLSAARTELPAEFWRQEVVRIRVRLGDEAVAHCPSIPVGQKTDKDQMPMTLLFPRSDRRWPIPFPLFSSLLASALHSEGETKHCLLYELDSGLDGTGTTCMR